MKKLCSLGLVLMLFVASQACNNGGGKGSKQNADSINKANKPVSKEASDFMTKAAVIDLMEIKVGGIAQEQATTTRIQDFAHMLVQDHQEINGKLKALANTKNVVLPDSLDQQHKSDISDLKNKSGEDFNEAFIDDMVKGHKEAINTYQEAAKNINAPDIIDFATSTLTLLKKHLDSAEAIQNAQQNIK